MSVSAEQGAGREPVDESDDDLAAAAEELAAHLDEVDAVVRQMCTPQFLERKWAEVMAQLLGAG